MTFKLKNELQNAQDARFLLVSLWMHDPEMHKLYHKFAFRESRLPLVVAPELPPIPVFVDPCTDRFLQDKAVEYVWEPYLHESSGQRRVRITHVRIGRAVGGSSSAIVEDWVSFQAKFLDYHRKRAGDPESEEDEPPESLEQFAARHNVKVVADDEVERSRTRAS